MMQSFKDTSSTIWYLRLVEAWSTTHTCMNTYICMCVWFYTFLFYTFDLCVIRSGRHTIDTFSSKYKSSLNTAHLHSDIPQLYLHHRTTFPSHPLFPYTQPICTQYSFNTFASTHHFLLAFPQSQPIRTQIFL